MHNNLSNYYSFIIEGEDSPRVFASPVIIQVNNFSDILESKINKKIHPSRILHVSYDENSKLLYSPNYHSIEDKALLDAIKLQLSFEKKEYALGPIIQGDPYALFRIRNVKSFKNLSENVSIFLSKNDIDVDSVLDINVFEVNLSKMPLTKSYFDGSKQFLGGYYDRENFDCFPLKFITEDGIVVYETDEPFILIDTSSGILKGSEKEWIVALGIQTLLLSRNILSDEKNKTISFFAANSFLDLGWPWGDISEIYGNQIQNLKELIISEDFFKKIAEKRDFQNQYWCVFSLNSNKKVNINTLSSTFNMQYLPIEDIFILESKMQISEHVINNIFKTKEIKNIVNIFYSYCYTRESHKLVKYQKSRKFFLNEKIERFIKGSIEKVSQECMDCLEYEFFTPTSFFTRKISDYPIARKMIEKICKKKNMPFIDLPVVLGPIEHLLGNSVQGGFIMPNDNKTINFVDFEIMPPLIAINSVTMPSYSEQTSTLIHEYSHYLFWLTNPDYVHKYMNSSFNTYTKEWWSLYLSDADEVQAHREQIAFELKSGQSIDEIILNKLGPITYENYDTAIIFFDIIMEINKDGE